MLRTMIALLCLALAAPALAGKQQERMKTCNQEAGDLKGDERKAFMSKCLKGEGAAATPQQRMKDCNEQAAGKKGEERKAFMRECLKAP